jgi:mono/diheme cytochrome c family protein
MSRTRCSLAVAASFWLASYGWSALSASSPQATGSAGASAVRDDTRATIDKYCVTCHNQRLRTGDLALDVPDLANVPAHADVWEKVIRKVRAGMMPPAGLPRPDEAARRALVASLESTLDQAARTNPNPGRPLAHRLNRAEYANAVRDLLALDVDVTSMLPPDDSSGGFDNNADVLGVSPVLLESYLTAAERIAALAIGDPKTPPNGELFRVRQDESQNRHIDGLPLGTMGGIQLKVTLPLDGEYQFQVRLFRTNLGTTRGLEYPHQLEISVDGARVHLASFGGDKEIAASSDNPTTTGDAVDGRFTARVPLKAGPRTISVAFIEKTHALNTRRLENYERSSSDTIDFSGSPHIDEVLLTGPFSPTGSGDTPSRRRIFTCRPPPSPAAAPGGASARLRRDPPANGAGGAVTEEEQCAQKIIATLARRAYRGDVTREDTQALLAFFKQGRSDGGTFESGIDLALRRMLVSPKFIFRVERDPSEVAAGGVYRLSNLAIASRLSFFLWSTAPDEELLDLAEKGRLDAATLERQVRRMLADPRSQALIDNFLGQWLQLRNLKGKQPNSHEFPDFDDNLRVALQTEVELFFASIIREDRSVMDLLNADYTFVNERLAKHYGIPYVYGTHFRRVALQDEVRRGLLGKGALLMVTSHPHRTSPVLRGKWILENVLGAPPPPPPDVVPPFEENTEARKPRSVRERMEQHRQNPACAGCHRMIDPAGLALENFDAVGAWRTRDGGTRGTPIDASGQLVDGTAINGVTELRAALVREPRIFVQTLTERLLTYALGRGLDAPDMPAVRAIARDSQRDGYRFSSIVLGIVRSVPFQMRIKGAADEGVRAANVNPNVNTNTNVNVNTNREAQNREE